MKPFLVLLSLVLLSHIVHGQVVDTSCGTQFLSYPAQPSGLGKIYSPVNVESLPWIALPVSVHIVRHDDGSHGINESLLLQMITNLNTAFAPARMTFFLRSTDYIDDTYLATLIYKELPAEQDVLCSTQPRANSINIYLVDEPGFGGAATFTADISIPYIGRYHQGIILDKDIVTTSVVPHEMGHFFNVFHTFEEGVHGMTSPDESNASTTGDLCTDTPAEPDPKNQGANFNSQCQYIGRERSDHFLLPYNVAALNSVTSHNFMMYTLNAACRTDFTAEQTIRIRSTCEQDQARQSLVRRWIQVSNVADDTSTPLGGTFSIDGGNPQPSGEYSPFVDAAARLVRTGAERFDARKHYNWDGEIAAYHLARTVLPPSPGAIRFVQPRFRNSIAATVKATMLDLPLDAPVAFRDPWYLQSDGTQPNSFLSVPSPFYPTGAYNASSNGLFMNMPFGNPALPFYEVATPDSLVLSGVLGYFLNWTGNSVVFANAGSSTTALTFTGAGATGTAFYKGHLRATSEAFTGNNQRKVAVTSSGVYCIVYASANRIWFTRHTGGAASAEFEVSAGSEFPLNSAPSICSSGEMVNVIWQNTASNIGGIDDYRIYLRRYNAATGTWSSIQQVMNGGLPSASFSVSPVVDAQSLTPSGQMDMKVLIWRDPTGLMAMECYEGEWGDPVEIPGTDENCLHPSIALAASFVYALAWENSYAGSIRFVEVGAPGGGSWSFANGIQVSPGGWSSNARPSIGVRSGGQFVVVWESRNNITEDGTSVHVRKTTNGSWESQITSFSMSGAATLSPVVGTITTGSPFSVVWTYGSEVFRSTWNGSSWSGPWLSMSNVSEPNINLRAVSQLQEVWRFTDGTARIGGTRYSVYPGKVAVAGSSDFNVADSAGRKVDFRMNRHALVDLARADIWGEEFNGTLAFELATLRLAGPSGEETLPLAQEGMRSKTFTVTEAFPQLLVSGAVYGAKLEVPPKVSSIRSDPLARVVLKDSKTEGVLKEIWSVPFSTLSTVISGAFGSFQNIAVDLTHLLGREVFLDVQMIGEKTDVEPIIVTDYLISTNKHARIAKKDAGQTAGNIPTSYMLHQNYPNPFNPMTTITFGLPEASRVTLKIYSVLGEEVLTLVDGSLPAGMHSSIADLSRFPTGVYLYRISAGKFTDVKKLLLLK